MENAQPVLPKRWKVALLIWVFIFPFITFVPAVLRPILAPLEMWQRALVMSLLLVPIMVYFYLPFLHRAFFSWLRK
jgi:antibiotic biosynthesis monooxygenase (ABM) superfamily enzyme